MLLHCRMFNKPKYIMKRMIKTAVIMIACFCFVSASAQSVMFITQTLHPIPGHSVDLEDGVKAHNAKFHASGESTARLFAIITGPRSGQYSWVTGSKPVEGDRQGRRLRHGGAAVHPGLLLLRVHTPLSRRQPGGFLVHDRE